MLIKCAYKMLSYLYVALIHVDKYIQLDTLQVISVSQYIAGVKTLITTIKLKSKKQQIVQLQLFLESRSSSLTVLVQYHTQQTR